MKPAKGQLGRIEWEFVPRTLKSGDAILVRIALPGRRPFDSVLTNGTYTIVYEDDENRVEYAKK